MDKNVKLKRRNGHAFSLQRAQPAYGTYLKVELHAVRIVPNQRIRTALADIVDLNRGAVEPPGNRSALKWIKCV